MPVSIEDVPHDTPLPNPVARFQVSIFIRTGTVPVLENLKMSSSPAGISEPTIEAEPVNAPLVSAFAIAKSLPLMLVPPVEIVPSSFGSISATSIAHAPLQPSAPAVLPSSHASFGAMMPLPHALAVQLVSQPSPSTAFPSSHASPVDAAPLPQPVGLQLLSQPSPLTVLPSSHISSTPTKPLPQYDCVQF